MCVPVDALSTTGLLWAVEREQDGADEDGAAAPEEDGDGVAVAQLSEDADAPEPGDDDVAAPVAAWVGRAPREQQTPSVVVAHLRSAGQQQGCDPSAGQPGEARRGEARRGEARRG